MVKYEIEKNIPVVTGGGTKYPYPSMDVGDSFKFSVDDCKKVSMSSSYYGTHNSMKFKVSKKALRCWRVS